MKRLCILLLCLGGCTQAPVSEPQSATEAADWPAPLVAEPLRSQDTPVLPMLDVGIVVFDAGDGNPEEDVDQAVRNIESRLLVQRLREVLVTSGAWGAVRILPSASPLVPLTVTGSVVHSDGSDLVVAVEVADSTGRIWLRDTLHSVADSADYPVEPGTDPFDELWVHVANRMSAAWQSMDEGARNVVLEVAALQYAQTLSPEAFAGFLRAEDGRIGINRLPARDDPMLARVTRIRDYEYLFIDAMDEQFVDLQQEVGPVYNAWREATKAQADWFVRYNERTASRESNASRGSFASMHAGYATYRAVRIQQQDLYDFARGFSNESSPTVLAYEDRVVELGGTLDSRYRQWRELLTEIFRLEQGFAD